MLDEIKILESKLHPFPLVNGCKIMHEHESDFVLFSAWKNGYLVSAKYLKLYVWQIMKHDDIYFGNETKNSFEWLTEVEQ